MKLLSEQEYRDGKTNEIGDYHIWFSPAENKFNISTDWSEEREPDEEFNTYEEMVKWFGHRGK